ncbi:MAG: hypothetical protein IJM71_07755 [Clostridia bacterium]|nr:hypothetical protein [Clostridia bacterium]
MKEYKIGRECDDRNEGQYREVPAEEVFSGAHASGSVDLKETVAPISDEYDA